MQKGTLPELDEGEDCGNSDPELFQMDTILSYPGPAFMTGQQ